MDFQKEEKVMHSETFSEHKGIAFRKCSGEFKTKLPWVDNHQSVNHFPAVIL